MSLRQRTLNPSRKPLLAEDDGGLLLRWYDLAKRDLPWRKTTDPYAIWVSEIMLQQTQVATVIPYWEKWMARFPTVQDLAESDEQDVLSIWQGLGYYRRCRLLLAGAKWVGENGVPNDVEGWLSVPGVGRYTSGAIASIAQNVPAALVDGNVERVYSRLTGDDHSGKTLSENAWKWAEQNVFSDRPGDWNQALMELGATVCTPNNPSCESCPLQNQCVARQTWRVDQLPTKPPKAKVVKQTHTVWVPRNNEKWGLRQIAPGQWWEGMWEFPRVESAAGSEADALRELVGAGWPQAMGTIRHSVTIHRIRIDVYFLETEQRSTQLQWFATAELAALPMPAPQRKILKLVLRSLGL